LCDKKGKKRLNNTSEEENLSWLSERAPANKVGKEGVSSLRPDRKKEKNAAEKSARPSSPEKKREWEGHSRAQHERRRGERSFPRPGARARGGRRRRSQFGQEMTRHGKRGKKDEGGGVLGLHKEDGEKATYTISSL